MRWRLLLMLAAGALALPSLAAQPATVRVGLWTLWHDRELVLAPAPAHAASFRRCPECAALPLNAPLNVRVQGDSLALAGQQPAATLLTSGALLLTAHNETITLPYPLTVTARKGELVLSVTLPLERYVERVVASESGSEDSLESLKALAVVVRSFALHQAHGHAEYQLCDSTHCQLLRWGQSSPRQAMAHAATLATAGESLWFHGHRAEAWFHQDCGGRTAAPAEIWPTQARTPQPWLRSQPDAYCPARPWSATFSLAELTTALAAQGLARPGWTALTIVRRGASGRATALHAGQAEFTGEQLRLAVGRAYGYGHILSDWFELTRQGDRFTFNGRGSGHGVGLCQAGAAVMAAAGSGYRQILSFYFADATAADEASGQSWQSFSAPNLRLESLDPADGGSLAALRQALALAEARTGLHPDGPITVRAFPSTEAFRRATLAPGWVAAFTEGRWIALQPLRTLSARKLLEKTLRHELAHALIEGHSGPTAPLWLREGLAELWSSDEEGHAAAKPALKPGELDPALAHATTLAGSEAAHRAAAFYATRLLQRFGRERLLEWLRNGVPASALATLSS